MYFYRKYETPQFCSSKNEGGGYGFRLFPPPYFRGHKQHLVSELSKKARFVAQAVIKVFKIAIRQAVENAIYKHNLYVLEFQKLMRVQNIFFQRVCFFLYVSIYQWITFITSYLHSTYYQLSLQKIICKHTRIQNLTI